MPFRWEIQVEKDYLKFSAAHFLVFPDGTAETLHGHNYKVFTRLRSRLDAHGMVLNFRVIKPMVHEIVSVLDEHMIVPAEHPRITVEEQTDGTTEIRYQERRYVIPTEELRVLPMNNTSAENLARWVAERLLEKLAARYPDLPIDELTIGVEETEGQQGVFTWLAEPRDPGS